MKTYNVIRHFILQIEAESEEEAISKLENVSIQEWQEVDWEAEEIE